MAKTTKKVVAKQGRSDESPEVSPVYFLSLGIENILCFRDWQVLNLADNQNNPAQWTVILGDNGVGKTTLLRCLAGMQLESSTFYNQLSKQHQEHFEPLLYEKPKFMEAWIDTVHNLASEKTTPVSQIGVELACKVSISELSQASNGTYLTGSILVTLNCERSIDMPLESRDEMVCYGYGAIRSLGKIALNESLKSDNSLSLFTEGAPLINAEEWLLQTDYACRTASGSTHDRLQNQITQIIEILKHILPDVEDIRIAPADEANPHPRAEFLTPYGWVHINSLGLGYRTAIAWMVDLAVRLFRRYPNSPDPLAEPAIVLVDEIDLHLHPRWQRTIMDFLTDRFPNTQFIVTAHSPLVVQAAQNANIVLLRREGDRVVIDNDPEIIENWRVDQVLTSVFGLPTARSAELDDLSLRREALLNKAKLTKKEETELDLISEKLGSLPTAESPQEIKAMNIIRRAAKYLESK
jgi:energy-coupling factor transporter ATP-binding protein EcfA2